MIFLIPAENVCFHNFPAVFTKTSGVVTGGVNVALNVTIACRYVNEGYLSSGAVPRGGHVYPIFLKIDFLICLNSMIKCWGWSFLATQGSALVSLRLQFSDQS